VGVQSPSDSAKLNGLMSRGIATILFHDLPELMHPELSFSLVWDENTSAAPSQKENPAITCGTSFPTGVYGRAYFQVELQHLYGYLRSQNTRFGG
jgi:hypothetical protein